MEALTQALSLANAEVKALRDQCDDLRSTVQRTRSGNPPKNFSKMTPPMPAPTSSRKQSENFPEIAYMNEDEAKKTLAVRVIYPNLTSQLLNKYSVSIVLIVSTNVRCIIKNLKFTHNCPFHSTGFGLCYTHGSVDLATSRIMWSQSSKGCGVR